MTIQKIARERNMTATAAAKRFGKSPRTIRRLVALDRSDYLAAASARREKAARLYETGATWDEIAAALGCTREAARALTRRAAKRRAKASRTSDTLDLWAGRATNHRRDKRVNSGEPFQEKQA